MLRTTALGITLIFGLGTRPAGATAPRDADLVQGGRPGSCATFLTGYPELLTPNESDSATALSLAAEPGSIEHRSPGVIAALIELRQELMAIPNHPVDPVHQALVRAITRLRDLANVHRDYRLNFMIRTVNGNFRKKLRKIEVVRADRPHSSTPPYLQRVYANLWELTVACLFGGERIFINAMVSQLHPYHFDRARSNAPTRNEFADREIDVGIQKSDGSWRWLEVKDWDATTSLDPSFQQRLAVQFLGQDSTRAALKLDIELTLIMKYGLPSAEERGFRHTAGYDRIFFFYPRGGATP